MFTEDRLKQKLWEKTSRMPHEHILLVQLGGSKQTIKSYENSGDCKA